MKDNIYEMAVEKVTNRMNQVSNRLATNFKGVKPFGKEEIPKTDLLTSYQNLGTQDMDYLVMKHGREVVNSFIQDMEVLKRRQVNG